MKPYLVFLVNLLHASFALGLRDDLSSILEYALVRLICPHSTQTVAAVLGIQNLDAIVVTVAFCAPPQLRKRPVVTLLLGKRAIGTVALVGHDAIVARLSTAILNIAVALRSILLVAFP